MIAQSRIQKCMLVVMLASLAVLGDSSRDGLFRKNDHECLTGDVELHVVLLSSATRMGEIIPLKIEVVNRSDHELVIDRQFILGWNVTLTVVDEHGASYRNDSWRAKVYLAPASDRLDFTKLSPGEYYGSLDGLGSNVHIDSPGVYDITFVLHPVRSKGNLDNLRIDDYLPQAIESTSITVTII